MKLTLDHVVPETLGGRDVPENLRTACADCNGGKSATPPDASQVAQVAADAQRWAIAQKAVAEQLAGQVRERQQLHHEFDQEWRSWTEAGNEVPRPSNWTASLDSFLNAGLPKEVIFDCMARAMENRKILRQDIFRYMCGIAWARINTMRDLVADKVKASAPPGTAPAHDPAAAFAAMLLGYVDDWEKGRALAAVVEEAEEEGREVPEGEALLVEGVEWLVGDLFGRVEMAWRILGELFDSVPESMLDKAIDKARSEMGADSNELDMVPRTAMHLVVALRAADITEGAKAP